MLAWPAMVVAWASYALFQRVGMPKVHQLSVLAFGLHPCYSAGRAQQICCLLVFLATGSPAVNISICIYAY